MSSSSPGFGGAGALGSHPRAADRASSSRPTSRSARGRTAAEGDRRRRALEGEPHAVERRGLCVWTGRRRAGADLRETSPGTTSSRAARAERRARRDGVQRAGFHPRDLGHDGQAEARRPHARRLPGPHRQHGALGASACRPSDVWWSTSDIGWIVGHSYIVYAPLLGGLHDARVRRRDRSSAPDTLWKIVEEFGVTGIFTSPTAVRLLMRYGEAQRCQARPLVAGARLLRRRGAERAGLGLAAEPGAQGPRPGHRPHVADGDRRPGVRQPVRHRACCRSSLAPPAIPLPGIDVRGRGDRTARRAPRREGDHGDPASVPGLTPTLWGEPERYGADYWEQIHGVYYTGDSAHVDEDGYVWFAGRADEIIKIAGHRHRHDRGRDGVPAASRGRRGGRARAARRAARRGHLGVRGPEAGARRASDGLRKELLDTVRAASSARSRSSAS